MQRVSEDKPPSNSLADILNKEVHVDEFADAFLRVLHDSTDSGLWGYLKQSSSSVESPQAASDSSSATYTAVDYDCVGSAPANDPDGDEATVDLPAGVAAPDALLDDIVRLSAKQDEKTRATVAAAATAQSHYEFPEVAGLEHAIVEAGRRHASLRTDLRNATTDRDAMKAKLSVAEGEIRRAERRLVRFRQLASQRPQELRSVLADGASFNEVFRRFSADPNSLVDLYDWNEVVNSKLSVLEYFAKDILALDAFTVDLRCMFEGCDFSKRMSSPGVRGAACDIPRKTLIRHVVNSHSEQLQGSALNNVVSTRPRRVTTGGEFSCELCSPTQYFATRRSLTRHRGRRHPQDAATPEGHAVTLEAQGGTTFGGQHGTLVCRICSSEFAYPELLSAHLLQKHGVP